MAVKDKAGVLSKISGVFAKNNVSINEVRQVAVNEEEAQIIVVTHVCSENFIKKTLEKLQSLDEVFAVKGAIRIEE